MATNNRISATLSLDDKKAVLAAIETIKSKLPFMIILKPEERKSLRKTASKRQGYVADIADGVRAFPGAMPSTFNTAEFLKDAELYAQLSEILPAITGLTSNIEDTHMQLGSELITQGDIAYGYFRNGSKLDSNLKPTVEKISAGVKRKSAINNAGK